MVTDIEDKYEKAKFDRQKHLNEVLKSTATKKVIVAGPGTGKTYLFKEVLKNKSQSLTLTFVNSLVENLSLELYGLSDVKTLHSFARSTLSILTKEKIKIYPKLSTIIKEDAKIILNEEIEFDHLFNNKEDVNKNLKFYTQRRNYYDNYYGYTDIIFSIVKNLENEENNIPTYDQILVDEFQDFNKLEVSLIDLLAKKSSTLLVGDDDQALYAFKSASTEHIRGRHSDINSGYTPFSLPYCSRCTRVIVEAVNDIIGAAKKQGHLNKRIEKKYQYFDDKKKDKESDQNPKIAYKQLYAGQIPWYIEKQIGLIAKIERNKFSVLIITPTKLQTHIISQSLRKKGLQNIESANKVDDKEPPLIDGLKLLLENDKNNLGWRIVSKFFLTQDEFKELLVQTNQNDAKKICEIIDTELKQKIKNIIKNLKMIKNGEKIEERELIDFLKNININPLEQTINDLSKEINNDNKKIGDAGIRKIPIKVTTIQSSKGLSADYVFIAYFDNQYFIKNKNKTIISDQDICNLLVALTRARKKLFLISSNPNKEVTFIKWIHPDRIEKFQ